MNRRSSIFCAICFICTALSVLCAVSGIGAGETYVLFPEPYFESYISGDVSHYDDQSRSSPTVQTEPEVTVNINTASAQELADVLPGIGEVKAQSIVEYREAVGGFRSVDELIEVPGIGKATLERIRPYCVI